jgi:single-stranded-DNA-specific exonuclease
VQHVKKAWRLLPHDGPAIERLAGQLGVAQLVAQLLLNRQVKTPEDARHFLHAPLKDLHEPELVPGMLEAARRLHDAVRQQRPICVYGDYDVDGVTGTAILYTTLQLLGAKVEFFVPHRLDDGYGLNVRALENIARNGGSMVVTVDCGIASLAEANEARRLGLELIITDHHEFKTQLPTADVLVHPRLDGGKYPFGGLCGSGVAFKLAWAVAKLASGGDKVSSRLREFLLDAVALVALGTVADVMPLFDENRVFVRHGLARLRQSPTVGLRALLHACKLDGKSELTATDIGYSLAPRLNAAGRLGSAQIAVELLLSSSSAHAEDLARELEELNLRRQELEKHIYFDARKLAEQSDQLDRAALVLAHGQWHAGLIGIVAGRLAEQFGRPTLMITISDKEQLAVGSGRSIPGFRLHEALAACAHHLLAHGGHAAAAGFRMRPTAIMPFRESFCNVAAGHFTDGPPRPYLTLDAEVPLSALTFNVVESLAQLEPYGNGNPPPLLLTGDVQILGIPRRIGNDRHLTFRVRHHGKELRAIAFGMADRLDELMSAGGSCCLAFEPRINEWQGWSSVELFVRDFQSGPRATLEG